jgi:hypothetical protein
MKKLEQILLILLAIITISSCGGIKVTDSWTADNTGDFISKKILVIARTDDMVSRQRFEQEMAGRFREAGFDAIESYKKFPNMKHNVKRTEEEITQVVQIIKNEGFHGIVLTVLKDKSTELVTSETGGYTAGGYYPSYYGGHYGGFGGYYGRVYSPYGYGYGGSYVPSETRTYTSETYYVETVIYNMDLDDGKQLISVTSVEVTDPGSASKTAPKYADAVTKALQKRKSKTQ